MLPDSAYPLTGYSFEKQTADFGGFESGSPKLKIKYESAKGQSPLKSGTFVLTMLVCYKCILTGC